MNNPEFGHSRSEGAAADTPLAAYAPPAADEVSLTDIYLFLRRHWMLFFLLGLGGGIAGGVAGLISQERYEFNTTIEIGTMASGPPDEIVFEKIETPEEVANKLKDVFIPRVRRALAQNSPEGKEPPRVFVDLSGGTDQVTLRSEAPMQEADAVRALHERIAGAVLEDHAAQALASLERYRSRRNRAQLTLDTLADADVFAFEKAQREAQLQRARDQVAALSDERDRRIRQIEIDIRDKELQIQTVEQKKEVVDSRLAGKEHRKTLLDERIGNLQTILAATTDDTARAIGETQGEEARALTMMLVNNQMQIRWDQLTALQTERSATLPSEIEELRSQRAQLDRDQQKLEAELALARMNLAQARRDFARRIKLAQAEATNAELALQKFLVDHRHQVADQQEKVRDLDNLVASIRHTRLVGEAVPATQPSNPGIALLAALGIFGGLFLAMLIGATRAVAASAAATLAPPAGAAGEKADRAPRHKPQEPKMTTALATTPHAEQAPETIAHRRPMGS